MKLHEALLGCSTSQLRRVAEAWGLSPELGTLRNEFADLLSQAIVRGAGDPAFRGSLDDETGEVLHLLWRGHGRHEAELLVRRVLASTGDANDDARRRIEQAVGRLTDLGLVYRVFEADGGLRRTVYVLPDERVDVMAAWARDGTMPARPLAPAAPTEIAASDVVHDLFVLASALQREARAATSRGLTGRPARSIGQVLTGLRAQTADGPGEPARRWQFLLWVGKRLGWLGGGSWPVPDDERVAQLLGDRLAAVREVLSGAGTESRSDRLSERGRSLAQLHADVLQILSEVDPEVWWPVDELLGYVGDQLGADWNGEQSASPAGSVRRAREAVRRWLAGRWHWLGLVDWGKQEGNWTLVAITPALSRLMGGLPPDRAGEAAPCALVEPRQLIAPASADLATLYRCERYLAYRGGDADERRYDLTPASVARGIRLGGDEDDLLASLARLLQSSVPPTWTASIRTWCRANSALRIEPRLLLVASDEAALAAALATHDARRAVTSQLSPRHAIVSPERLPDLLTGLAAAGQPVDVDAGLRVEPRRLAQAAALGNGAAEAAWIALDVLRRLGGEVVAEQRDLTIALGALEATLSAQVLETLERRARTIAALLADRREPRRRPQRRRRVV